MPFNNEAEVLYVSTLLLLTLTTPSEAGRRADMEARMAQLEDSNATLQAEVEALQGETETMLRQLSVGSSDVRCREETIEIGYAYIAELDDEEQFASCKKVTIHDALTWFTRSAVWTALDANQLSEDLAARVQILEALERPMEAPWSSETLMFDGEVDEQRFEWILDTVRGEMSECKMKGSYGGGRPINPFVSTALLFYVDSNGEVLDGIYTEKYKPRYEACDGAPTQCICALDIVKKTTWPAAQEDHYYEVRMIFQPN